MATPCERYTNSWRRGDVSYQECPFFAIRSVTLGVSFLFLVLGVILVLGATYNDANGLESIVGNDRSRKIGFLSICGAAIFPIFEMFYYLKLSSNNRYKDVAPEDRKVFI